MVSDVMEESAMIDSKHIYKMDGTDAEVRARGDAAMLKQVLRIFVQNAEKNRTSYDIRSRKLVEVTGFEPATFWSRTKRATKLRYTSTWSQ